MSSETQGGASSSRSPVSSEVERGVARYLLAVSVLSETSGERIATVELEAHLDVTPAGVTEMPMNVWCDHG